MSDVEARGDSSDSDNIRNRHIIWYEVGVADRGGNKVPGDD
jgi:hypothetical protein